VPWPVDWKDTERFYHFGGYVKATAERLGIAVVWGADFNDDGNLRNDPFVDLPHWQLKNDAMG
jgi:hypothetical protein